MTVTRERLLYAAATLAALTVTGTGNAEPYPSRPVRIIVPFAPGAPPEIIARLVGSRLSEQLGQPMIVDPRPGASGVIAAEIAKNATPDGYTLLLAGSTLFAALPALKPKLPYDIEKDFAGLSRVGSVSQVLAVHASIGVSIVADLVTLAKAQPGQLNYGSAGNGSSSHLAGEMLNVLAGIKTVHVPYKASSLALNDLIAGQVQFIIPSPPTVMPHAKGGRIKVLATTGAKRDPLFPDLPTVGETVPGFEFVQWWGVAAPVKTPALIVKKLHSGLINVLQTPEMRDLLAKQGATPHAESPAEFSAFIRAERERIGHVGRQVGVTLD